MKVSTILKSGLGLIYTTVILAVVYMGIVWLTQYIVNFTWTGAILFWLIGLPIAIGLFQVIATIMAMPIGFLLRGTKWFVWILLLPTTFFLWSFGRFLWIAASEIGGILVWLLLISWFFETAWMLISYFMIAIGAAYEPTNDRTTDKLLEMK